MNHESVDPDVVELAERLEASRPRPSSRLRERVRGVLAAGLRDRMLRRQSVWLVTSGTLMLVLAALLALNAPT